MSAERGTPPGLERAPSGQVQERNVHGAQDLLHLKYSEEAHFLAQEQIKREELGGLQGGLHHIRIPFESAMLRHQDQDFRVQREEFLRAKQERAEVRLSVHSPPMRDVVAAVRDSAVPVRDVMQAVRDTMNPAHAHNPAHSLAQTIHQLQQNSYAFTGLQGPPL